MICVQQDANGYFYSVSPQPADASGCTAVLVSGAEYAAFSSGPFTLSLADGATIAAAVVGVWAIGWAYRLVTRSFNQ